MIQPRRDPGLFYIIACILVCFRKVSINVITTFFLSVDPLAADFASWSTYHYTYNNPIRFIDPDGRAADDIINIEKSTGAITVTKAEGDDVVNLVDNGNVLNSAVYGKNGSFQEDNQIYQLESDAAPGVTSTIIMGTNAKALQTVYEVAAGSDVEFGKLDVTHDVSPVKSLKLTSPFLC